MELSAFPLQPSQNTLYCLAFVWPHREYWTLGCYINSSPVYSTKIVTLNISRARFTSSLESFVAAVGVSCSQCNVVHNAKLTTLTSSARIATFLVNYKKAPQCYKYLQQNIQYIQHTQKWHLACLVPVWLNVQEHIQGDLLKARRWKQSDICIYLLSQYSACPKQDPVKSGKKHIFQALGYFKKTTTT